MTAPQAMDLVTKIKQSSDVDGAILILEAILVDNKQLVAPILKEMM